MLAFYNNDFTDNITDDGGTNLFAKIEDGHIVEVPPNHLACSPLKAMLKDNCCLLNLVAYSYDLAVAMHQAKKNAGMLSGGTPLPDDSPAVVITKDFLGRFQKACEEKGARFVLVYVPGQAEIGEAVHPIARMAAAGRDGPAAAQHLHEGVEHRDHRPHARFCRGADIGPLPTPDLRPGSALERERTYRGGGGYRTSSVRSLRFPARRQNRCGRAVG